MSTSFLAGLVAGYGVAIPVGAIAVLIIEAGIRRGFRAAAAAGAGAATADGVYATVAAAFGVALADLIQPWAWPLRLASVVVLAVIGLRNLRTALAERRSSAAAPTAADVAEVAPASAGVVRTYATFLGLTLLNPATVIYFAALILGLPAIGDGAGDRAAFVVGAFVASFSWQWFLAGLAAVLHRRLPPGARSAVGIVGAIVVLGFAVGIATGL